LFICTKQRRICKNHKISDFGTLITFFGFESSISFKNAW
jgi:hypothetical protein